MVWTFDPMLKLFYYTFLYIYDLIIGADHVAFYLLPSGFNYMKVSYECLLVRPIIAAILCGDIV